LTGKTFANPPRRFQPSFCATTLLRKKGDDKQPVDKADHHLWQKCAALNICWSNPRQLDSLPEKLRAIETPKIIKQQSLFI
jgi:hypothetical protein